VNIARLEARFGSRSPAAIVSFAPSAVLFVQPSYLVGLVELATKVAILAPLNASIKILLWGFKESLSGVRDRPVVVGALAAATLMTWVAVTPCVLQIGDRR
jgi:hypothetical protein